MSNARTASLVVCAGSVYMLPVAAYTTRRLTSTVGADQMPAPDGPYRVVPELFFPIGLAASAMEYVCQITSPVAMSSAATLPRNVQHSYCALPPWPSSPEDTGTY